MPSSQGSGQPKLRSNQNKERLELGFAVCPVHYRLAAGITVRKVNLSSRRTNKWMVKSARKARGFNRYSKDPTLL